MQNAFSSGLSRMPVKQPAMGMNAFADASTDMAPAPPVQGRTASPAMPKQPATSGAAPFTNAFADDLAPPKPPGRMQQVAGAFFQGLAPEGYNQGLQMAQQRQAQQREQVLGQVKAARSFLAQGAKIPEAQRAQWFAQNAAAIKAQTGQDPLQGQTDYSDASIMQGIAALDAHLGVSPVEPEPMSAYEAAQIELKRAEAQNPQLFNTADGIVAASPGQDPRLVYGVRPPQQDLPEGMMYGDNGQIMEIPGYAAMRAKIAAAGRAQGDGAESYRSLSPEEVAARGYPKGTVVQVDGRGKEYVNSRPSTQQTGQPTESERGAGLHAAISLNGIQAITQMEQGGYNRADFVNQMAGGLAGERERLYDQAADEFIDGYLRAMTGAAATKDEIATYKRQWFPQFGDSEKVLEQKAKGRLNALKGMKSKAGRAWQPQWDGVIANLEQELGVAPAPTIEAADMQDFGGFIDSLFDNVGGAVSRMVPGGGSQAAQDEDAPPPGVDPEDWAVMPEEDRALFR